MKRLRAVLAALVVVAVASDGAHAWSLSDLFGGNESDETAWRDVEGPATEEEIQELGFDEELVDQVTRAVGEPPRNLHAPQGEADVRIGLVWSVEGPRSRPLLEKLAPGLARRGYQLFLTHRAFGTADDRIGLVKTADPLTAVQLQRPGRRDPSISTAEIVRRLRDWNEDHPWDLVGAGPDWVEIRFHEVPQDLDRILLEAREIAPAAVSAETADVDSLRTVVLRTGRLLLWWEPPLREDAAGSFP